MIAPLGLNYFQLRFGRVLQKKSPPVVIQKHKEEQVIEKETFLNQENTPLKEDVPIHLNDDQINPYSTIPLVEQPSISLQDPPFPERLKIDKGIERRFFLLEYDMQD